MPYGTIKIDTITFTDAGVDKSIAVSGLVQNPTFTGNVTVTGTVSGDTVRATTVSGVTVSGTTANFASGVYTTQISGAIVKVPAGTAGAPTVQVGTGASIAPGLYSPATDQLGISTGGSFRLVVDSTGRVGIGTSSPGAKLDVSGSGNLVRLGDGTNTFDVRFQGPNNWSTQLDTSADKFNIQRNSTSLVTVDSLGRLGIGTTSPVQQLHVKTDQAAYTWARIDNQSSSASAYSGLQLAAFGNTWGLAIGSSAANSNALAFVLDAGVSNSEKMRLDTSGRLLVGTSSNDSNALAVIQGYAGLASGQGVLALRLGTTRPTSADTGIGSIRFESTSNTSSNYHYASISAFSDGASGSDTDIPGRLVFSTTADGASSPTERMRITSAGQILIGTTAGSPGMTTDSITLGAAGGRKINIYASNTTHMGLGVDVGGGPYELTVFGPGGNTTNGTIRFGFITEANPGTWGEKARLTAQGYYKASNTGTYTDSGGNDRSNALHHMFRNDQNNLTVLATNTNTSTGVEGFTSDFGTGATGCHFIGAVALNRVFIVAANGNVTNANNSYGAISDIKLKENIVDASSQWDDLKALQVRNYNFKEGQTHTQIGLVAQEVELISPGLVAESPDLDAKGNELGTVTKSVNYSVLYMKAVKALQEAMERIEQLESRLTAAGIE